MKGYKLNRINTDGYNMYPPNTGYGLLIADEGTVYYSGTSSSTITWICRMLGYQSYAGSTRYYNSYTWQQSFPVRYRYLYCAGSVVPQCQYKEYSNTYNNGLYINCNARSQYGDTSNFYLADRSGAHTQNEYGLLMYSGGTVSGRKFDDETAELMCHIMGYNGAMSWKVGPKYIAGQESLRIRITNLNCMTKDRAFPLCTYGTDAANSTHDEDVWLWCDKPNTNNLICPPGQRKYSSDRCFECSAGTYSPDPTSSTSCSSCPSHSTSLAGSTFCSCNEGTYMNSAGNRCLTCPEKSTSKKGSTFCSCEAGTYLYTSGEEISCVQCPGGKISKEGSTAPADCVDCPSGTAPINNGQACSCDEGYGWEWSNDGEEEIGYCKPCLANFYKSKMNGTCAACPKLATSIPLSGDCQCPRGMFWDGESCMNCQGANNTAGGVCDCLAGSFWNEETSSCNNCPRNHFSGNFSTKCTKCPVNTISVSQSAECSPCSKGSSWQNYTCTQCEEEEEVGNGVVCIACPEGFTPLNNHTCSCDKGYGWEWTTGKEGSCKACPANFYKDKDQGICMQCPHEATSLPLSQDCMCPGGLSWDGSSCVDCASPNSTAGVCDCIPGTFRSEESGNCEPCPTNHFSGKFATFCMMCPLFTVSVPQSAECTSCPKGFSWENYTCTECPDNHVGNGATCSVCPEGTSPSKDKTICQKSAVDSLSVGSLVLSALIIIVVLGIIFVTWRERQARKVLEDIQLTYQADSSSGGKVKGRRCMCPSCPCSEVPKPALPERGKAVQQDDVYANFS